MERHGIVFNPFMSPMYFKSSLVHIKNAVQYICSYIVIMPNCLRSSNKENALSVFNTNIFASIFFYL